MKIKKIVSAFLAMALSCSLALNSNARTINEDIVVDNADGYMYAPDEFDGYTLTSVKEFYNEDGLRVVQKIYERATTDTSSTLAVNSSSGSYDCKIENEYYSSVNHLVSLMVYGYFTWDQKADTVKVTNYGSKITYQSTNSYTYEDLGFDHGDDQGSNILFGHKYAFIEKVVNVTPIVYGTTQRCRLWVDVDVEGSAHVDTSANRSVL